MEREDKAECGSVGGVNGFNQEPDISVRKDRGKGAATSKASAVEEVSWRVEHPVLKRD